MDEHRQRSREAKKAEKVQNAFENLQKVLEILKGIPGLHVIDQYNFLDTLKSDAAEVGFPLIEDGAYGLRASYSEYGGLSIYTTNEFEKDPEWPEIRQKIREAGIICKMI